MSGQADNVPVQRLFHILTHDLRGRDLSCTQVQLAQNTIVAVTQLASLPGEYTPPPWELKAYSEKDGAC